MTVTTPPTITPGQALDAAFAGTECELITASGSVHPLPIRRWRADADAADYELFVRRCHGYTLDIGCGPGRLTVALARHVTALGIDVSREALHQARARGANVLHHNVFEHFPRIGWDHVLLADGNIGIGGDPVRMLRRAAELTRCGGELLVELDPYGAGIVRQRVRLRIREAVTEPFAWATVGIDAIESVAQAAGLLVESVASSAGRYVATIVVPGE